MTSQSAIVSPLQKIITLVTGTTSSPALFPPPHAPERALGLGGELTVFTRQLEHVLTIVNSLGIPSTAAADVLLAVHDEAEEFLNRDFDPAAFAFGGITQLAYRVYRGAGTLAVAGPMIVSAARFSVPSQWLEAARTPILAAAHDALMACVNAVSTAWAQGQPATGMLMAADDLLKAFPKVVRETYLNYGLDAAIDALRPRRDDLHGIVGDNPPVTPASYTDVSITAMPDGETGVWLPTQQLHAEVAAVRGAPLTTPAQTQVAVDGITRKIQAYHLTLIALTTYQQMQMVLTQFPVTTDASQRLLANQATLATALDKLHAGFTAGGAGYVQGATAVANLLNDAQFKADFDAAVRQLTRIKFVETVVLTAAIVTAAALTGGMAATAAEAMIGALGGDVLFAGFATWAEIGGFAAEVMTFTIVDRAGRTLLFGPESTDASSFKEDLFWNAVTMGTLKIVSKGYGALFREVNAKSWRFRAGNVAADQITLFAIGQVQASVKSGHAMGLSETEQSLAQQIAMALIMGLGAKISTSVRARLGDAAPAANQGNLDAVEQGAANLAGLLNKINNNQATPEERAGLAATVEAQFNAEAELVRQLPDDTDGKAGLTADYRTMTTDLEVRAAVAGLETSVSGAGSSSSAAPAGPGVIVFEPAALNSISKVMTEKGVVALGDSPVAEGAKEAELPNGQHLTFVPAAEVKTAPPKPAAMEKASLLVDPELDDDGNPIPIGVVTDRADIGEANLKSRFKDLAISEFLARMPPNQQRAFLRFVSHPEFVLGQGTFLTRDLVAFGFSPAARAFGSKYSPTLAKTILKRATDGAEFYGHSSETALRAAAAEIDAADPAARSDLMIEMMGRSRDEWRVLAGNASPAIKLPPPDPAECGVVRESDQWEGLLAIEKLANPTAPLAALQIRADIEQVLDRAGEGDFDTLSEADRHKTLVNFLALCHATKGTATELLSGQINGKVGAVAEWLLLPNATKTIWYLGARSAPRLGTTKPDDYVEKDGKMNSTELKANDWDAMTAAEARAVTTKHVSDITGHFDAQGKFVTGDAQNLKDGTTFDLWYAFEPSTAQRASMMEVLQTPGARVTRVRFGLLDWEPIVRPGG